MRGSKILSFPGQSPICAGLVTPDTTLSNKAAQCKAPLPQQLALPRLSAALCLASAPPTAPGDSLLGVLGHPPECSHSSDLAPATTKVPEPHELAVAALQAMPPRTRAPQDPAATPTTPPVGTCMQLQPYGLCLGSRPCVGCLVLHKVSLVPAS